MNQLNNLNICFALDLFFRLIVIPLIVLLKLDSNCLSSFILSWVDKITTGK